MSRYRSDPELGDYQNNNKTSECAKFLYYTWKTITCLFSHIFLVSLVVSYCVLGAFTFEALEVHHERDVKRNIFKLRYNVTNHLWKLTKNLDILEPENFTINATIYLKEFENALLKAMTKDGWDGEEDVNKVQWTSTGALFYSIIVITTIALFLSLLFANIICEETNKWVWGDNNRQQAQARYDIYEDDGPIYPQRPLRPGFGLGSNNYLNRPGSGFTGGGGNGLNNYVNRPQFLPAQRPGGLYGTRPGIGNNYGNAGGILTGPVPSWVPQKPFKNFDHCKCTERFNCQSPGISYGHCDTGKQYCCISTSKINQIGDDFPSRPIHDPALGVLAGPGGPTGVTNGGFDSPHQVPLVGSPGRPIGHRPSGFGIGPDGVLSGPIYGRSNSNTKA